MRVVLEIASGQLNGRKIPLREGESVLIGRTEWSDLAIPEDLQLSSKHFVVECQADACLLRDLGSTNGTFLNDRRLTEPAHLAHGDQITAGTTRFRVSVDGPVATTRVETSVQLEASPATPPAAASTDPAPASTPPPPPAPPASLPHDPPAQPARRPPVKTSAADDFCQHLTLDDDAKALLEPGLSAVDFLDRLTGQALWVPAVQFWSAVLPAPYGVQWASQCVRQALADRLGEQDADALDAAERWALDPSEEHRRAAEAAAQRTDFETPAAWVALAAFWSGGSIAPPGLPEVPPQEGMAAKALAGALMLAATSGPAEQVADRYQSFIELGKQMV